MKPRAKTKSWPRRNLKEVISFLESQFPDGLTVKDAAACMGVSQSHASEMLKGDDMRLAMAENIARSCGCELHLHFQKSMASADGRQYPRVGNLAGLSEYISMSNRSVSSVSMEAGCSHDMLSTALKTGDIKLSFLMRILEALNISCQWEWQKIGAYE